MKRFNRSSCLFIKSSLRALMLVQNPKTNLNHIYKVKTRTTAIRQARERFQAQLILISQAQQLILLNNPLDFVLVHVLSLVSSPSSGFLLYRYNSNWS